MEKKDFMEIREQLNNPDEEDMTPYPIVDDTGMVNVIGDANKTEVKAGTYNMTFRVPIVNKETDEVEYKTIDKTYKNVFITPRLDPVMSEAIICLKAMLYSDTDGKIEPLSEDEAYAVFLAHSDEFIDIVHKLVAAFLKVDKELVPYMSVDCVMEISRTLFKTYPELIKSSNAFFTGLPLNLIRGL